jgi:hypothetical protein
MGAQFPKAITSETMLCGKSYREFENSKSVTPFTALQIFSVAAAYHPAE